MTPSSSHSNSSAVSGSVLPGVVTAPAILPSPRRGSLDSCAAETLAVLFGILSAVDAEALMSARLTSLTGRLPFRGSFNTYEAARYQITGRKSLG